MEHKTEHTTQDLGGLTARQLRTLRRRLASGLSDPEALLRGTLVSQGRRCGKENCRCADGELHGPYTYVSVPRPGGRPHTVYVPAEYPHGWDLSANIVINLTTVPIDRPGFYNFDILIDDQQVRTLPFRAVKAAQVQTV